MNERVRDALISDLEEVVDKRKQELQTAINEGASNLEELTKKMLVATIILLVVYLIFEYKINKNAPKNRFNARVLPLVTLMLQNGTRMVLSDLFSKVVDYLELNQSEKSDEEPDSAK